MNFYFDRHNLIPVSYSMIKNKKIKKKLLIEQSETLAGFGLPWKGKKMHVCVFFRSHALFMRLVSTDFNKFFF